VAGSKISIHRTHRLDHEQAVRAADRVAAKLKAEHSIRSRWDGDTLHFERTGVTGTLRLRAKELQLEVELGFLLMMFRDSIAEGIDRALDKELEPKPAKTKRKGS
jgi:putative polyhydroxyalkanoate system protein